MSTQVASYLIIMLVHFMSLNAQGFRSLDKQREIMHFARAQNVDILFLQECNFHSPLDVSLFRTRFSVDAFFSLSNSVACGVGVVFLRSALRQKAHVIFGLDGRTIAAEFYLGSRRVRAVNVYAPAQHNLSSDFFRSLDVYLLDSYATFLVGDFNCVLDPQRDVRGPGQRRPYWGARELRELVSNFRLTDAWVHLHGSQFAATWARGAAGSRLDKFFFPPELMRSVVGCAVLAFPPGTPRVSDHLPLSCMLQCEARVPRHDVWRMDLALVSDPLSAAGISASLAAENANWVRGEGWDALKARWRESLVNAGRERKARITEELNNTLRRLRIAKGGGDLTFAMRDYVSLLQARYERLLRQSSQAASQAYVQGRPLSDPAVLRHVKAAATDRQGHAWVPHVELENGELSEHSADISRVFMGYFKSLFTSEVSALDEESFERRIRSFCGNLPRVPNDSLAQLVAPVSEDELWEAVNGANAASAPGPDGIPAAFYKAFFVVVRDPLLYMVNRIIAGGAKPTSFCEGKVILLAKEGGEPSNPKGYRPISLLNADYKLVAAIIAKRVSCVLPDVVSLAQTCCVPGRTVFSSLSLTRDLFTFASRCGIAGCFVSVDQAKAFDRVEHRYLLAVLRCFGFPQETVTLIGDLYSDLTTRLLVNGQLSPPFGVTRGIRQGCPLSPLLFVLCLDPLLRRVADSADIRGFPLPGQGQVKVSAYADDVSLFLRDEDSFAAFLRLFAEYSELSGALLNRGKSKALRFGTFASDLPGGVDWVAGVKVLGVVFHASGEVARRSWREMLAVAEKKLAVASEFPLSLTERAFIIKSSAASAFFYVARVARPPARVARKLATLFGSFFWEGKSERVKRAFLRLPRDMGGFGIPCLPTMFRVLALRGFSDLAADVDYRGRALLQYFLGTARRDFFDERVVGPTAEEPPAFYRHVTSALRMLRESAPELDWKSMRPTKVCEALAIKSIAEEEAEKARRIHWRQLTSQVLPPDVRDFGWRRGWGVLPTGDTLAAWGVTRNARCPQCGQTETIGHALKDCRVAKTFWRLLTRTFGVAVGADTRSRDAFTVFLVCVGAYLIWKRRGVAALRAQPLRAMFPLLWKIRSRLIEHLETEFATLGEQAFLQRWSTRFIRISNKQLQVGIVPY
ncbi:hypothetical protein HPB48_007791 [Haemaphysalis longicornis]|uniref:Reverse transcriptase domain-containing protein n=1 Tax=Haemaphysalis longicornis TaxID=44386 RepID=A0A9J6G6X8_HAELO|nr:hypothetical protein HPB48_007791 [Haemaphysalis longicornis]